MQLEKEALSEVSHGQSRVWLVWRFVLSSTLSITYLLRFGKFKPPFGFNCDLLVSFVSLEA